MDIFDRLKAAAAADWQSYVDHDFGQPDWLGHAAARGVPHLSHAGLPVSDPVRPRLCACDLQEPHTR